jgi:hypothetical protein
MVKDWLTEPDCVFWDMIRLGIGCVHFRGFLILLLLLLRLFLVIGMIVIEMVE